MTRSRRIAARFSGAAHSYGGAALIQRQVAEALAQAVEAQGLAPGGRVLEFGCGSGFLTLRLARSLAPSLWIASDIAPAMLGALAKAGPPPCVRAMAMDAEAPAVSGGFDLVCSSLALQWLADPAGAIDRWRRLARPGGLLAVSTLLHGSFRQWRAAVTDAGAPEPGPVLPTLDALMAWTPGASIAAFSLSEEHEDGLGFLRAARRTGVDAALGRTLDAGTLRRALRTFEASGAAVDYEAALVLVRA